MCQPPNPDLDQAFDEINAAADWIDHSFISGFQISCHSLKATIENLQVTLVSHWDYLIDEVQLKERLQAHFYSAIIVDYISFFLYFEF